MIPVTSENCVYKNGQTLRAYWRVDLRACFDAAENPDMAFEAVPAAFIVMSALEGALPLYNVVVGDLSKIPQVKLHKKGATHEIIVLASGHPGQVYLDEPFPGGLPIFAAQVIYKSNDDVVKEVEAFLTAIVEGVHRISDIDAWLAQFGNSNLVMQS